MEGMEMGWDGSRGCVAMGHDFIKFIHRMKRDRRKGCYMATDSVFMIYFIAH